MPADEDAIRDVVRRWHEATHANDIQAVLQLMTDDVVFLVVGRKPFGKQEFAAMSAAVPAGQRLFMDVRQTIEEIQVFREVAYVLFYMRIRAIPSSGGLPVERAGHTLAVFRKVRGHWLLARDANLLTQVNG